MGEVTSSSLVGSTYVLSRPPQMAGKYGTW
jgi:hypothetical protein